MTERPFDIAELEAVLALPPDHPRRRDLEADPRFRAIVRSYRRFLAAGDEPATADMQRAEARLDGFIDDLVLGETAVAAPARSWFRSWRPYLVGGLVAAALGLVLLTSRDTYGPQEPGRALRWEGPDSTEAVTLVPGTPEALPDGARRVVWRTLPTADAYAIAVYRSDLTRVGFLDAGGDTSLTVERTRLVDLCGADGQVVVRILGLAGADTIARSAPVVLRSP